MRAARPMSVEWLEAVRLPGLPLPPPPSLLALHPATASPLCRPAAAADLQEGLWAPPSTAPSC